MSILPDKRGAIMHISAAQARAIIAAAEARAQALGVSVNIAVLDAGAHLKAFSRMDSALLGTIDVALKKARTSALLGRNTEVVADLSKPDGPFPGLDRTNGGLVTFTGGIPIRSADGVMLGAVGVSGGDPAQDLDIAQAACDALLSVDGQRRVGSD